MSVNARASGTIAWNASRWVLVAFGLVALFYAVLAVWLSLVPTGEGIRNAAGGVLGNDFLFFYSASKLVLASEAAEVFDQDRLFALQQSLAGFRIQFPWAYPPHVLMLAAPLALLPYTAALYAWLVVLTAPFVILVWRASALPVAVVLCLPPLVQNTIAGQNGVLTATLIAGGIMALQRRRSVLAGVLFGLLAYKPQVFILAPIGLAAIRDWRALAALALSAVSLPLISLALFGSDLWWRFLAHLPDQLGYVFEGRIPHNRFPTIFIFLFEQTGSMRAANIGQALGTIGAWGLTYWSWRRSTSVLVRSLALCVALPLSVPYLYEYDLAIWSLPAALFVVRLWNGSRDAVDWIAALVLAFLPPVIWISSLFEVNYAVFGVLALVPCLLLITRCEPPSTSTGKMNLKTNMYL